MDRRYAASRFHNAECSPTRTLFTSSAGLEDAKRKIIQYKTGKTPSMTADIWEAKKIVDSTVHPDTGQPVLLPFRMSCFVLSNLIVTAGMLTPNLKTRGTLAWQITNQSLNVAINHSNANKSSPLSTSTLIRSYLVAVTASCSVALGLKAVVPKLKSFSPATKLMLGRLVPFAAVASAGALNVFLMRGEEIRRGIDVFPSQREGSDKVESLGKSRKAATIAVGETAVSRVLNSTPVMVLPALILVKLQQKRWLMSRPWAVTPVNLALIFATSIFALPLALAAFPQRQSVRSRSLEEQFWDEGELLEFNRGI